MSDGGGIEAGGIAFPMEAGIKVDGLAEALPGPSEALATARQSHASCMSFVRTPGPGLKCDPFRMEHLPAKVGVQPEWLA